MRFSLESEFTHATQDGRDHGAPLSTAKKFQADEKGQHIGPIDSSSYQGIISDFHRLSTQDGTTSEDASEGHSFFSGHTQLDPYGQQHGYGGYYASVYQYGDDGSYMQIPIVPPPRPTIARQGTRQYLEYQCMYEDLYQNYMPYAEHDEEE
ncbi:hypothetical protein Taro_053263 [Colocasia esculenta]|uniref:Uncharacterized protein n=1 Tax=Colocasia esculenta TaxID=4460 RepID=A0A843XKP7_COLES|nr:hypothetical protein [Colocasia esculenta]